MLTLDACQGVIQTRGRAVVQEELRLSENAEGEGNLALFPRCRECVTIVCGLHRFQF